MSSTTVAQQILSIQPNQQTCLHWALGEPCPPDIKGCPRPHRFYPTIVWRTLPSTPPLLNIKNVGHFDLKPQIPDHHQPKQLKSTRCPLWPSSLCPWSSPDLCPYAHATQQEAEANAKMQECARHLTQEGGWEAVVRMQCRECGKLFEDMEEMKSHVGKGCWKKNLRQKLPMFDKKGKTGGHVRKDVERLEIFRKMSQHQRQHNPQVDGDGDEVHEKVEKEIKDMVRDAWIDIRAADEAGLWPKDLALRQAAKDSEDEGARQERRRLREKKLGKVPTRTRFEQQDEIAVELPVWSSSAESEYPDRNDSWTPWARRFLGDGDMEGEGEGDGEGEGSDKRK